MTQTLHPDPPTITVADRSARAHITSGARLTIDLRGGSLADATMTTDIRCPKCGGTLSVDEVDTTVLAAQLRCHACFLNFLQRLHDERNPSAKPHRWVERPGVEPTPF
ncbi:MAG: hypothetical protein HYX32_03710 [Actinobacteria bacterium]|nr:hypothetical protein [Actinomycetota bacterium]